MATTNNEMIIFKTEDNKVSVDVRFEGETVWLTIEDMARLFEKSRSTINEHVLNVYSEGELDEKVSKRKIGISDFSTKPTNFYNLDVIISVGYRVKSLRGTQFRQWATKRALYRQSKKNILTASKHSRRRSKKK
ncbi:MAG: virulence RhuM family protein [Eggerthellaceae bacterium]|nr:virulence RhuM family protein [Eggerthellaceae bacterium]